MDGSNLTKLTNNSSITPCYEGLKSSFCHSDQYQEYIVYSKRVWQGFGYGKWDVFRFDVQTSEEINLTNSPDKDEYDPVFRSIFDEKEGFIFYSANVFSENAADVWSAYYNTEDIENTNLSLVFWTGNFNTTEKTGEIDFISKDKLAAQTTGEIISIKDTRIVYTNGDIYGTYIYRSDNDGTTWETEVISHVEQFHKTVFAIDPTGGKIIYGENNLPSIFSSQLVRINHDGTPKTTFAQSTTPNNKIKDACWSPDGRWVVFVKQQEDIGKYGIYAKMATQDINQSDTGLLTDVSAYDIEHPCFSPSGTELVFSQKTTSNSSYDIYMLSIRINDTTSINTGILTQLTYTSTIDERHPSYSPDGKKIMFLSNNPLADIDQIYTMDTNGSGLELVVAGTNDEGQDINLRKPVFGIANDNPDSYYIAYISDNADSSTTIKIATLPKIDSTPGDGKNLATLYQDTGLKPSNISENFTWGRKRNKGTIVAQRIISEKTAKNQTFQYKIAIDVDEAAPPNAYTLEEIVSENFSNIQVSIDGSALFNPDPDITTNPGYKIIKILFGVGLNGGVKDHVVIFQMDAPNEIGNAFIEGKIRYNLEGPSPMGTPTISVISGNSSISISNPFIPVDIYTNENAKSSDGIIGDWDILYAIDAWANNNQLSGFGIRWPMDINNWDMIMLAIIDIWTSPSGTQGTHTGGLASDPSIEAGEYQYIGPYLYTTGGGIGINEMYWTQGKWVD
ncbi:MAG TPA: hypothetical protein PKX05_00930 [bacterium]|nr:hypothetical protein [bacterium]